MRNVHIDFACPRCGYNESYCWCKKKSKERQAEFVNSDTTKRRKRKS